MISGKDFLTVVKGEVSELIGERRLESKSDLCGLTAAPGIQPLGPHLPDGSITAEILRTGWSVGWVKLG